MSRKWVSVVVCALIGTVGASASNWITVWDATGTYDLRQDLQAVKITSPGVFKIWATGDYNGLGVINSITVDPNVTVDPNLTIEVHVITPDGGPGAYDVRLVDLSANATTIIGDLRFVNAIGQDDMLRATRIDGGIYDPTVSDAIVNGLPWLPPWASARVPAAESTAERPATAPAELARIAAESACAGRQTGPNNTPKSVDCAALLRYS